MTNFINKLFVIVFMKPDLIQLEKDIGMLGNTYPFNLHEDYVDKLYSAIELTLNNCVKVETNTGKEKLKILIESGIEYDPLSHYYGQLKSYKIFEGGGKRPTVSVNRELSNPIQAIVFFKEFYGINTPQKTVKEIAEENNVSRTNVRDKLSFIKYALTKNKKDIWYGMI